MAKTMTQQDFLRQAVVDLGEAPGLGRAVTREEMCERRGCPVATFNKWMLAPENGRDMPPTMWNHIREILEHEKLKRKLKK